MDQKTTSIDVATLPAFYLTVNESREKHMQALCSKFFKKAHFAVHGITNVFGQKASLVAGALGHKRMIELALALSCNQPGEFRPFVILEDDVELSSGVSSHITIPGNADAVFIGISSCGLENKINRWQPNVPLLVDKKECTSDTMRVFNMLSTHAILINSHRFALAYLGAITHFCGEKMHQPHMLGWDVFTSRLAVNYSVHALENPLFYQKKELNGCESCTRVRLSQCLTRQVDATVLGEFKRYPLFEHIFASFSGVRQVSIDMLGGLGNQLFCIAAAYAYARKHGLVLCLDTDLEYTEGSAIRKTYWNSVFAPYLRSFGVKRSSTRTVCDDLENEIVKESGFKYSAPLPLPTLAKTNIRLCGYFQAPQYFQDCASDIARMLAAPPQLSEKVELWWKNLPEKEKLFAVHIRRGDFVNLSNIYVTLAKDYYDNAFDALTKENLDHQSQMHGVVFTDDVGAAKTLLERTNISSYNVVPADFDEVESFYLMQRVAMRCGIIIANSTFSWWAAHVAWTLSDKSAPVVCPRQWFGPDGPKEHSLHTLGWICV